MHNEGRNTAPEGLAIYLQSGGFIHGDFHLSHALAPGDGADFTNPATPFDHPMTNHDSCTVGYDH